MFLDDLSRTTGRSLVFLGNTSTGGHGGDGGRDAGEGGNGGFGIGGAVSVEPRASVELAAALFVSNTAIGGDGGAGGPGGGRGGDGRLAGGGAIYNFGGTVLLDSCILQGNRSLGGIRRRRRRPGRRPGRFGGVAEGGAIVNNAAGSTPASLTIRDSVLDRNEALGGRGGRGSLGSKSRRGPSGDGGNALGGAILSRGSTLRIVESLVTRNRASGGHRGTGPEPGIDGLGLGGGIALDGSNDASQTDSTIHRNRADNEGDDLFGWPDDLD